MNLLSLNNVSLQLANQVILEDVTWQVHPKARIALVGRNGAGKSTLLKLLNGEVTPDSGAFQKKNNLNIACLMQDIPIKEGETVYHFLVKQLGTLGEILTQYHEATLKSDTHQLATLNEQIELENAWDILPKIDAMASHLSLPLDAALNTLSGGERRRALLGAALLAEADLLLLDEPTNHLDIQTIEWLETTLKQYKGTLIVITHDRAFLKRVANHIVEIDRGKLYAYDCNYETYLDRKEAMRLTEITHNQLFDKRLKEEEAWIRQGIKARRTRNEGRVRQLKKMREAYRARREQVGRAKAITLEVKTAGKLVLEAQNISYSLAEKTLIHDFSITLIRGDKIGIVGPNGCGKTTLVRILLSELAPTSGTIRHGTNLSIAYFDQLRRELDEQETVMANVAEGSDFVSINGKSKHVASYLKDFLFTSDRFNQPVYTLSGGERNRLLLAKLFAKPVNLLVMDEPTNDLDIETLELLETMLADYPGTLLLISHDRMFLDNIVSSVLVYEAEGHIHEHVGGYQDYCEYKSRQRPSKPPKSSPDAPKKTKAKLNSSEARELKQLPKKIENLEQQIEDLQRDMGAPHFYEQAPDIIEESTKKLATLENSLAEAYERWEELENKK